jgi:hypothetical protein
MYVPVRNEKRPSSPKGTRGVSCSRGATLIRLVLWFRRKEKTRSGARSITKDESQPHSFVAGTVPGLRDCEHQNDTLGHDNGGVSGQPYWTRVRGRSSWQLPGPFTSMPHERAFTTGPASLTRTLDATPPDQGFVSIRLRGVKYNRLGGFVKVGFPRERICDTLSAFWAVPREVESGCLCCW